MSETIWVMESECCNTCGALLDWFEDVICTDCLHDAWYTQDEERLASFDDGYNDEVIYADSLPTKQP